jgi:hypothetical protein
VADQAQQQTAQPAQQAPQAQGQAQQPQAQSQPQAATQVPTAPAAAPAPAQPQAQAPAPAPAPPDLPQVNYATISDDDFRAVLDEAARSANPEAALQRHLNGAVAQKDRWRELSRDLTGRLDAIRTRDGLAARLAGAGLTPEDIERLRAPDAGPLLERVRALAPRPGDATARPEALDARGAAPQAGAARG